MFSGLSAFPLTPVTSEGIDQRGFIRLLNRLTEAAVDSIGVLGSTGSYAYLTTQQRQQVTALAKSYAGHIPVMSCIGAVSTDEVLRLAEDAQQAGADALLLPAVSYQPLQDDEVFGLFETLTQYASVPICIYDNPRTTGFTFSDTLLTKIAGLTGVRSVKIPGLGMPVEQLITRIQHLRQTLPATMTIGVSGDERAAIGLNNGCALWYSAFGGLFPKAAKQITDAAARDDQQQVIMLSQQLAPVWSLFRQHGGSVRVLAAAAGILGITDSDCLPRPLRPLAAEDIKDIAQVIETLKLD